MSFFSLWTKIWPILCHFWQHKSVFLQILHQSLVPSNITPLYFFSSNIIYFGQKQPIKVQIFEIFECSGQNSSNSSCQFWTDKSIPLQFLHHSSLSWHITPMYILSSCIFNFGQKNVIKVPILRLSSALVKICQIPHVIFGSTSQFSFKFFINLECNQTYLLCTFCAEALYTLVKSIRLQCKFLRFTSAWIKIS